jgi:superoxide oxidase
MTENSESAKTYARTAGLESGRFDQISITLHWLTVLLIVLQFSSAWLREAVDHDSSLAVTILTTHRTSGALIWVVSLVRLVWRHNFAYLPPFPESMSKLQQTLAKANEIQPLCPAPDPTDHRLGQVPVSRRAV